MNFIKSHFEMHTRFRNGILFLVVLIALVFSGTYVYSVWYSPTVDFVLLESYQKQIDSLRKQQQILAEKKVSIKPFNPNFITDYKGYRLGMSTTELDKLYAYRKKEKWLSSAKDFQQVTGISDSLLSVVKTLFKFPDWVATPKYKSKKSVTVKSYAQKKDLNTVTAEELIKNIGVPDFIADRIIRYRDRLEGFVDDVQLRDVKGLYAVHRNKIQATYTVKKKRMNYKININTASVKELLEIPYLDFETALMIKDFVDQSEGVMQIEELRKIEGLSIEKIERIALYLQIN